MVSVPDAVFKNRGMQPLARRVSQATLSLVSGRLDDQRYWYTPSSHSMGVVDTDVDTIKEATGAKYVSSMLLLALAFGIGFVFLTTSPDGGSVAMSVASIVLVTLACAGAVDVLEADLEPTGE